MILYISSNDGTDMRINKEIKSLSTKYKIIFIGVSTTESQGSYIEEYCYKAYFIQGERNTTGTITKMVIKFLRIMFKEKISSIHIVNEQLMIFFYPFLFFKYTVLDIFDSIFLKYNMEGEKIKILKKIVYAPINKLIVTDNNRKSLLPEYIQCKTIVIENYPNRFSEKPFKKKKSDKLTILFNGWLGMSRGGEFIKGILNSNDESIKILMAGWFSDEETKSLITHPQVEYRGVMTQHEALKLAASSADYILCIYAPVNSNNINASPNKIFDSIHTETPLIINSEIKVSIFVKENNIGVVLENYKIDDYSKVIRNLKNSTKTFSFSEELKTKYSWERIEHKLFFAHHP